MTAFDASYPPLSVSSRDDASAPTRFILIGAALILVSALLAGFAPIGFSIVAVFLFAGPHNWMEARYFLSQMPAHWGPLRPFFVTGIGGVVSLTLAFIALPYLGVALQWDAPAWDVASATWNTAMILWITALVMLRARQHPTRNWDWALPASLVLVAAVWVWPRPWEIFMVYLHPIIAMLFLWRVLGKRRRVWRPAFATLLATGAPSPPAAVARRHEPPRASSAASTAKRRPRSQPASTAARRFPATPPSPA